MIAWINVAVLLFSSLAFLLFYMRSVSPAGLERASDRERIISVITCG
jgi:hypothetical protein